MPRTDSCAHIYAYVREVWPHRMRATPVRSRRTLRLSIYYAYPVEQHRSVAFVPSHHEQVPRLNVLLLRCRSLAVQINR